LPDISTTEPFVTCSAGHAAIVSRRAPCSFRARPPPPLFVGHLQQVDLRHGAGNIEQRIDAAK